MKMCVAGPIFNPKIFKRLYETKISTLYKMGENILAVILFWRARDIFLLFGDHHDTEYEKCKIYVSISKKNSPIKIYQRFLWNIDIHTLQDRRKKCGKFSYIWS